jgi:protocatechuate 3,4-dioxygenase alpha subunit
MRATPSQTIGPFFHLCLAVDEGAGLVAGPGVEGQRVTLICRVLDGQGAPVDDALIELWQADASGVYDHPHDPRYQERDPAFHGFGRMATNSDGEGTFETLKPGRVRGNDSALDAPHIHVAVFARGLVKQVRTRIYFSGDPANREDSVLALVPADRRDSLMARPDPAQPSRWMFDIHLSGERETVFFEI